MRVSVDSIADATFTISGCRAPSFSASWACWRCSSFNWPFSCWMNCVVENRRKRVERRPVGLDGSDLRVARLLLDAVGARARHRGIQIREPLHDNVLAIFERHGAGLLAVLLQRLLALFQRLPLIDKTRRQKLRRFLRGEVTEFQVLLDEVLGHRVGRSRGKLRIGRAIADIHQPGRAHGRDADPVQKCADDARLCRRLGSGRQLRRFGFGRSREAAE